MRALWDNAPCSLVKVARRFRGTYSIKTSETSVYLYETAQRNIPEGCHLHICRRENLNSRK
jgi:hypothetical protein